MKGRMYVPFVSWMIFTFVSVAAAQDAHVVRWRDSDPNSKQLLSGGAVAKRLVVDEISITASIVDCAGTFCLALRISNSGRADVDVAPDTIRLIAIRPNAGELSPISAAAVSQHLMRAANDRAASLESQGNAATTTVHEQVPVIETSFNPASILDPTQPTTVTTMKSETVVKTVPDEAARFQLQSDARNIRLRAELESDHVTASALMPARLRPNSDIVGTLYFNRDDSVQEVLVRATFAAATVEIPFKAVKKSSVFGRTVAFK